MLAAVGLPVICCLPRHVVSWQFKHVKFVIIANQCQGFHIYRYFLSHSQANVTKTVKLKRMVVDLSNLVKWLIT